jgi:hypothetical protein
MAHRVAKNVPAKMTILHKHDYGMHPVLIRRAKIRFQIVDWWPPAAAVAYSPEGMTCRTLANCFQTIANISAMIL